MNEHTRIANALREASANIHEIQNKGCEHDLEINEQITRPTDSATLFAKTATT